MIDRSGKYDVSVHQMYCGELVIRNIVVVDDIPGFRAQTVTCTRSGGIVAQALTRTKGELWTEDDLEFLRQTMGIPTREVADAYVNFLYSPQAQDIEARNFYRPRSADVAAKYAAQFPQVKTFTLAEVFGDWRKAQAKFFADGAIFDQIGPGN